MDADSQDLTVTLDKRLFPFLLRDRRLDISEVTMVLRLNDPDLYAGGGALSATFTAPDASETAGNFAVSTTLAGQVALVVPAAFSLAQEFETIQLSVAEADLAPVAANLVVDRDGKKRLNPDEVNDVLVVLKYTVAN